MKERKKLIFFGIFILAIIALSTIGFKTFTRKFALAGQNCGGSRLDAKECVSGYYCKSVHDYPPPPGAGGVCVKVIPTPYYPDLYKIL